MSHVVMADRGDHWHVVADYSNSPRHRAMSEAAWKQEFLGTAYSAMRKSDPSLIAAVVPRGVGRWKKDWSKKLKSTPGLVLLSEAPEDFDGVPCVDAGQLHEITISKVPGEPLPIRVILSAPIPASSYSMTLGDESVNITVGPASYPCDLSVTVADVSKTLGSAMIKLRFK